MTNAEVDALLAEKLEERIKTPRSEFINMDHEDTLFADIRTRLTELAKASPKEKLD